MKIELQKPPPGATGFSPGERLVIVDGVAWGRTIVKSYGPRGRGYSIAQLCAGRSGWAGSEIGRWSKGGHFYPERVSRWSVGGEPLNELVIDLARKLIIEGRLKSPDVEQQEQETARREYVELIAKRKAADEAAFRKKAAAACVAGDADREAVIDRIVSAMRWARTQ